MRGVIGLCWSLWESMSKRGNPTLQLICSIEAKLSRSVGMSGGRAMIE